MTSYRATPGRRSNCNSEFSEFSRDLILKEVSELNGIVQVIVRSLALCKQF